MLAAATQKPTTALWEPAQTLVEGGREQVMGLASALAPTPVGRFRCPGAECQSSTNLFERYFVVLAGAQWPNKATSLNSGWEHTSRACGGGKRTLSGNNSWKPPRFK
jgi:hypothetical protein